MLPKRGAIIRITTDGRTLRHIPSGDLILQIELRVATELNLQGFPCPCKDCHGGRQKPVQVIRKHHTTVGRNPFLTKSMIGGDPPDGFPLTGIWVEDVAFDDDEIVDAELIGIEEDIPNNVGSQIPDVHQFGDVPTHLDEDHDVHRQVLEALDRGDALHRETLVEETIDDIDEIHTDTLDGLEELYEQARTPLYTGAKSSIVSTTIVLMNMCVVFRVSNKFSDELFKYLAEDLLPADNQLPKTHYAARKLVRRLGLDYNIIHACPDGCVLFEDDNAELNSCSKCSKSRWLEGSNIIPVKVIRHFPLIPRLQKMWRSKDIAHMLTGWTKHVSDDGIMRSVVDSPAWKHVDTNEAFGNFGAEARNLRFALALDGVNPFKLSNTNWSTWPVIMLIYNLEPWFVTKKFFISLCILISGKHSPREKSIDVFIRPLLRELKELWTGVIAQDFSKEVGSRRFKLRGLLLWTISDFPAYGLISRVCCKGYKGCPPCGPHTDARLAKTGGVLRNGSIRGSKLVYGGIRRYLPRHHPYRRNKRFNGTVENRDAPPVMSALDVMRYAAWRQSYLDLGGRENGKDDPVHQTGVKRLNSFYELDYWLHLLAPHVLDAMHCEKNLCENMLKTLLGLNDTPGSRQDAQDCSIREEIWLQAPHRAQDDYYMPHAPYILSPDERREFVGIISNIRIPTNYVGSIHKRLKDGKLQYMKSHDYHVLMQQILPVAVRTVLDENVCLAIIRICRVFQKLCAKHVHLSEKDDQMRDVIMATCMLEKEFPPTFLNIMTHLPVHLVQQLFVCGPIHCRWMYPIERYMKTLKDHVRSLAHPEGSIAEGYRMEEALGFCTEYMKQYKGTAQRIWDPVEDARMNDELLSCKAQKKRKMSNEVRIEYILAKGQRWREREVFRLEYRRIRPCTAPRYPIELNDLPPFADWLRTRLLHAEDVGDQVENDVKQYAQPPERWATSHRQMYSFGVHLRVRSSEGGLVTRDSCVAASFTRQLRWGLCNGRPIETTEEYVGYIEEIFELDYRSHCTVVLLCNWVKASSDHRYPNIVRDKYGFCLANFNHMDGEVHPDSFAFPLHCQQVFFSDDPQRRGWKLVCRTDVRGRRGHQEFEESIPAVIDIGNDANFTSLQPQTLEVEPVRAACTISGTYIIASGDAVVRGEGTHEP